MSIPLPAVVLPLISAGFGRRRTWPGVSLSTASPEKGKRERVTSPCPPVVNSDRVSRMLYAPENPARFRQKPWV